MWIGIMAPKANLPHGRIISTQIPPSFLEGIARVFDFIGILSGYTYSASTPEAVDTEAIASDWQSVGDDLRIAMLAYEDEYPQIEGIYNRYNTCLPATGNYIDCSSGSKNSHNGKHKSA
jgi:hypothetical protein